MRPTLPRLGTGYNRPMLTVTVIWIAKLASWLTRVLGRGEGGALPGLIAERLQPGILEQLGRQLTDGVVLVTGTNGKTTTTRMVAAILGQPESDVLVNRAGSNLTRGLTSYLIANSNWRGRLRAKRAVFEVDEAAFPSAFKALKPRAVLILNLFRDQLDRYGELDNLAQKLRQALEGTEAEVILNADDPLVAWLGLGLANVNYFGMATAPVKKLAHDFAADSEKCPVCGVPLNYSQSYYAHIGVFSCSAGNFYHPHLSVVGKATKVSLSSCTMDVEANSKRASLKLELPGLYNLYNALAALALGHVLGHTLPDMVERLKDLPAAFGRAESILVDGKQLQLFLVKNPTGFNQFIQTYQMEPSSKPLLIIVNDLIADGRDVSWLWDVAFEDLAHNDRAVVSGTRVYDIALRLKYAGKQSEVVTSLKAALEQFIATLPEGQTGLVLPTYTAMLQARTALGRLTKLSRMNQ